MFLIAFSIISWIIHTEISILVPNPYMDEVFHIPQTIKYLMGNFSWDPKITTPPGLYLFVLGFKSMLDFIQPFHQSFQLWFKMIDWHSPTTLRVINIIFGLLTMYLIQKIIKLNKNSHFEAFIISLFPISFFFNQLFYTDSGSTFFVMLSYYHARHQNYFTSAFASLISIWFRQNNVIWMVFIAIVSGIAVLNSKCHSRDWCQVLTPESFTHFLQLLKHFLFDLLAFLPHLIARLYPFLLNAVGFIVFVYWNGGVVLGDKSNHQMSPHIPQLFYFFSFTGLFAFFHLNPFKSLRILFAKLGHIRTWLIIGSIMAVMGLIVKNFTIGHPFLLADNRHVTFYIWKTFFKTSGVIRYCLIPFYLFAMYICLTALIKKKHFLWIIAYLMCLSLVLIPSPLIEFRYFIIPYLLFRLNINTQGTLALMAEGIIYGLVNAVVFGLFLYRPFQWPHEPGLQRFMW
ncbi:alpha-2-glucosyltransferase Alg10 [Globomyces pollinis-pini]|nr:alpha-2-glucosyltransferase Alg10 [Globomyces pollinis-pini]